VDKLFQGKKGSKEHKAALNAIHNHYGTSKFASSVRCFCLITKTTRCWCRS
jgi:hypothetical protein